MIIIKTRSGDTIEIPEYKFWSEEHPTNFGNLCNSIRSAGYLMTPELYVTSDNILMIVRSPNATAEGTDTRQ